MANKHAQVTGLSTAKTFGLAAASNVVVPDDCVAVLLQAETQNVRFRVDGTAPTASVGMLLVAGAAPLRIEGRDLIRNLQVIETTASATLNVALLVR